MHKVGGKVKKIFLLLFILLFICAFSKTSLSRGEAVSESTSQIKVLFSPQDNCAQEVISAINNAKNYVYVAMYYFTSRPIAQAIVDASVRGVDVKVCMDGSEPGYEYSKGLYLENKNIPLKVITGKGIMHNKFCVIDDEVIITGSFNWTARADLENDENLLIIRSGEIAEKYKEEFERLWSGKKIDASQYTDETRAEKAPLEGYIAVTPLLKTQVKNAYLGHKGTKKLHLPSCRWASKIKPENKIEFSTRQEAIDKGYIPCKVCKP
jgi:phosphatidylserine/phosphatidylglycerophosphate/cardiolipin synthase-like enzyme